MTERRRRRAGPVRADLRDRGYQVAVVGRRGPDARWEQEDRLRRLMDGSDVVVDLAGRSVGCRCTDRHRDEISRSRVDTTPGCTPPSPPRRTRRGCG